VSERRLTVDLWREMVQKKCSVLVWLIFGHMNGASHGIIAHVYLVNNCGSYLKEVNGACIARRWKHIT
jgi:hypothetical protein